MDVYRENVFPENVVRYVMNYFGRKKELKLLEEIYQSDRFEFGYLYGQRRIGKTTLLEMFRENKNALMFYATDSEDIDIRDDFSKAFFKSAKLNYQGSFSNWYSFFEAISDYFQDNKGLLVIDEFPNIVLTRDGKRKKTDFLSSLQRAIDTLLKNSKITLILTGSNVSFLETEINDSKAPLYQRNTFSLLLKKFEWDEALDFLIDINDNFEKAKILALTNTFPYYLSLINPKKSFEANLDDLFYKETATFTDDPSKIITSNIVTSGLYASIIKNISNGNDTLSKLCEVLKTDTSKMTKYLKELIADNVIKKRANFNSNRNARYEICDPMLSYYYRFIRENSELIKTGYGILIKKEQTNQIKAFIERAFEYECLTYLEYLNKKGLLNTLYYDFGNCNIDNSELGRSIELDIVAGNDSNLLVAECKFSKNKRSISDYYDMKEDLSANIFKSYSNVELFLFGAEGFSEDLLMIKDKSLKLIDLEKMFERSSDK